MQINSEKELAMHVAAVMLAANDPNFIEALRTSKMYRLMMDLTNDNERLVDGLHVKSDNKLLLRLAGECEPTLDDHLSDDSSCSDGWKCKAMCLIDALIAIRFQTPGSVAMYARDQIVDDNRMKELTPDPHRVLH